MADAVIVSTARTPIGKAFRGIFNDTHGADMGAHVIKHAAERAKVDLAEVEDVILGCAAPEGTTGSNVARVSRFAPARQSASPASPSTASARRACKTISMAAQRVLVDKVPVMIAGGLESVSLVQGSAGRQQEPAGQSRVAGARAGHLSRHDHDGRHGGGALQDRPRGPGRVFAAEPSSAPRLGQQAGKFDDEILPMETTMLVTDKNTQEVSKKTVKLTKDEGNRPDTNMEGALQAAAGDGPGQVDQPPAMRASSPTAHRPA